MIPCSSVNHDNSLFKKLCSQLSSMWDTELIGTNKGCVMAKRYRGQKCGELTHQR